MRAGPLSNDKVIALLNSRFVPVYAVNEDYREGGPVPAPEKAEYQRIYHQALEAKFSTGTVHVYLLTPDGRPFDTLHVAEAAKTDRLLRLMEDAIRKIKGPEGPPLTAPRAQSAPPAAPAGSLVLHLIARGTGHGSWREFPGENWIVLSPGESKKLEPPAPPARGATWRIDDALAARILRHFHPQTENNDPAANPPERAFLEASVIEVRDGVARARLTGQVRKKHPFYPKREDGKFVDATVLGLLELDPATRRVRSLRLATDRATYGDEAFTAALRSVPGAKAERNKE